jgi:hypothetical protein
MKSYLPTLALLLTACLPVGAGACDLVFEEHWNLWIGECSLTINPKGPFVMSQVAVARPSLKIPDLQIDKMKFRLTGNQLTVHADIVNEGTGASPATTVELTFKFYDPQTPGTWSESTRRAAVPALMPMSTQRVFVSTFTVNYSSFDVDVLSVGMVDPVTASQPVRGQVFEVIESNNDITHLCRIYGPPADPSVRPCD